MAIIGGAGNPVGGSFTGAGESLEIVGDFGYATSGIIAVGSAGVGAESNLLNFRTGNFILESVFQFHFGEVTTEDFQYKIYLNDTEICQYVVGDRIGETPDNVIPVIIPPYTEVKATAANMTANNNRSQSVIVTGKLHRTRD